MRALSILVVAGAAALAGADFTTDFEAPAYIVGPTAPQNGWYLAPAASPSDPHDILMYSSNPLQIPPNPLGGAQFDGARTFISGSGGFPRIQHDHDFSGPAVWTFNFDFCAKYLGVPGTAINFLGGLSLQPSSSTLSVTAFASWVDPFSTPELVQMSFLGEDEFGGTIFPPGYVPGGDPVWTSLKVDNWYRICFCVDFTTNRVTKACISNITAGGAAKCFDIPDLYLTGNFANWQRPTAFRLAGSGGDDNVVAYDNLSIKGGSCTCGAPACKWDLNGDGKVCQEDLGALLAGFGTIYNQGDLGGLLSEYGTCGGPCN